MEMRECFLERIAIISNVERLVKREAELVGVTSS